MSRVKRSVHARKKRRATEKTAERDVERPDLGEPFVGQHDGD